MKPHICRKYQYWVCFRDGLNPVLGIGLTSESAYRDMKQVAILLGQ